MKGWKAVQCDSAFQHMRNPVLDSPSPKRKKEENKDHNFNNYTKYGTVKHSKKF